MDQPRRGSAGIYSTHALGREPSDQAVPLVSLNEKRAVFDEGPTAEGLAEVFGGALSRIAFEGDAFDASDLLTAASFLLETDLDAWMVGPREARIYGRDRVHHGAGGGVGREAARSQ